MATRVVDELELVEVEEENGNRFARCFDSFVELAPELSSVRQPCKRVVRSLMAELPLTLAQTVVDLLELLPTARIGYRARNELIGHGVHGLGQRADLAAVGDVGPTAPFATGYRHRCQGYLGNRSPYRPADDER